MVTERILIVEDKENLRYDLRRLVEKARPGCDVLEAQNETEAIQLINKALFGLILVDIDLREAGGGEHGGFEVLQTAKQREPNTQVIVITSFPRPEHIQRIRVLGGFNYVDRNTSYYHELLVREVGDALRLFEYSQQQSRQALVLILPEQHGETPRVRLLPNDVGDRVSRNPLVLNLNLLKEATAAIGSLVYLEAPGQRNALAQFVGRHVWNRLFRDHEVILKALGEAEGLVHSPADLSLRVMSDSEALDLPFELLHDGKGYLALRHPFVRVIRDERPTSSSLPGLLDQLRSQDQSLRILLLASDTCSSELGPIPSADQEVEAIEMLIKELFSLPSDSEEELLSLPFGPKIELDVLHTWESSREQVLGKLQTGYHIIHYAGHGTYHHSIPENSKLYFWEKRCQSDQEWDDMSEKLKKWYYVSDKERGEVAATARDLRGNLHSVTAFELANCFAQSAPLLVYLSCCFSAQAGSTQHRVFSKSLGLMDAVVRTGVPVIVGHRWPLLDSNSSVRFVKTFYGKLLAGYSPEQALLWARRAVQEDDPTWASAVMVVQSF